MASAFASIVPTKPLANKSLGGKPSPLATSRRVSGVTLEQQAREEFLEKMGSSMARGDKAYDSLQVMLSRLMSKESTGSLEPERLEDDFDFGKATRVAKVAYESYDILDYDNRVIRLPKYKRLLMKYARVATNDANTAQMNGFGEYAVLLAEFSEWCGSAALGAFDSFKPRGVVDNNTTKPEGAAPAANVKDGEGL